MVVRGLGGGTMMGTVVQDSSACIHTTYGGASRTCRKRRRRARRARRPCWLLRVQRGEMGEPRRGRTGLMRDVSQNDFEQESFIGGFAGMHMTGLAIVCESLEPGKPVWAAHALLHGAVPKHTEGKVLACDYDSELVHVIWLVSTNGEHPGHTSDSSGEQIHGTRLHLNGHNYDLNDAEWRRLPLEEQRRYRKWPPCAVTTHDKYYDGQSLATGDEFGLYGAFDVGQSVWATEDIVDSKKHVIVRKHQMGTVDGKEESPSNDDVPRVTVIWRNIEIGLSNKLSSPVRKLSAKQPAAEPSARPTSAPSATTIRTLHGTNYLRIYRETPQKPQQQRGVTDILVRKLRAAGQPEAAKHFLVCRGRGSTVVQAATALWTANHTTGDERGTAFFEELNRSIIADNAERLEQLMLFIRLVVNHITRPTHTLREETVTWRGSKLTPESANKLTIGTVIRPPMFVATSRRSAAAAHFMSNNVLIRLSIPAGCRNAFSVAELSEFKYEHEVLLPPYTPLRLLRILTARVGGETDQEVTFIWVKVLDGKEYEEWEAEGSVKPAACIPI